MLHSDTAIEHGASERVNVEASQAQWGATVDTHCIRLCYNDDSNTSVIAPMCVLLFRNTWLRAAARSGFRRREKLVASAIARQGSPMPCTAAI